MVTLIWLVCLIVIGTGIWVFFDIRRININVADEKKLDPFSWLFGFSTAWIIFFPLYIHSREKLLKEIKDKLNQSLLPQSQTDANYGSNSKYCPKCGKENIDTSKFCFSCGNQLSVEASSKQETVDTSNRKYAEKEKCSRLLGKNIIFGQALVVSLLPLFFT